MSMGKKTVRVDKPREPKENTLGDKTCQTEIDREIFE